MKRFIVRRLFWFIPTLWLIATLTFFFLRWIPGGPFDKERKLPPEIQANLAQRYGLDQPLGVQYLRYLQSLSRGDLGPSLKYLQRNTRDIIFETFPVSLMLGLTSLSFAFVIGLPMGLFAAYAKTSAHGRWRIHGDSFVVFLTSLGVSLPNFVFASFMILLFSFSLKLLPPALWEGPRYMLMPALTLAIYPMAYIARLSRASLLEALHQDYIQTARAKGVTEGKLLLKHALANSLGSVVSILGPIAAALITGSFIVEYIFVIPGMGQYFVTAVTNRDYPLVLGVTLVYALFVIVFNFLVDLAYTWLDPRIQLE